MRYKVAKLSSKYKKSAQIDSGVYGIWDNQDKLFRMHSYYKTPLQRIADQLNALNDDISKKIFW